MMSEASHAVVCPSRSTDSVSLTIYYIKFPKLDSLELPVVNIPQYMNITYNPASTKEKTFLKYSWKPLRLYTVPPTTPSGRTITIVGSSKGTW